MPREHSLKSLDSDVLWRDAIQARGRTMLTFHDLNPDVMADRECVFKNCSLAI